jgi:hypothetical protein
MKVPEANQRQIQIEANRLKRVQRAAETQTRLAAKLQQHEVFRALYIAVARIFAQSLSAEIDILRSSVDSGAGLSLDQRWGVARQISLAPKWAPTLGQSHDRATNICTAIAQILYAQGSMGSLSGRFNIGQPLEENALHTIRGYYRRWIVSPLRRVTKVTEVSYKITFDYHAG